MAYTTITIADIPVQMKVENNYGPDCKYSTMDAETFVRGSLAFNNWLNATKASFGEGFKGVKIIDIYPFGHPSKTVNGFVLVDAHIEVAGKRIPGFVFIRGAAVAILTILCDEEWNEFVLTTVQPRVPGSSKDLEEIPAGMMDSSNNFAGTAAKEMAEETGIQISQEELEDLGIINPSPGGCDEKIQLYWHRRHMSSAEIAALNTKLIENPDEVLNANPWFACQTLSKAKPCEVITLRIRPIKEFAAALIDGTINDVKAMTAYMRYKMMQ